MNLLISAVFIFISSIFLNPANPKPDLVSIPGLYSTGVDDLGNLLPDGAVDPHYQIISSSDPRYPGPESRVVLSEGFPMDCCWLQNNNRSKWIAPQTDGKDFNAVGGYIYRVKFDLSAFKSGSAVIAGMWSTDNNGVDILINGKSTGHATPIEAFHGMYPFEIRNGFVDGINTIDFVVYNLNAPTGLRVEVTGRAESKSYVSNIN